MSEIINRSINHTLSRTILTSFTTLLALGSLYFFGGHVIETFTLPIICGVTIGTYSSVFLASVMLLYFKPKRGAFDEEEKPAVHPDGAVV